jgi:thiol-disulfide isomerase/thioredoxin
MFRTDWAEVVETDVLGSAPRPEIPSNKGEVRLMRFGSAKEMAIKCVILVGVWDASAVVLPISVAQAASPSADQALKLSPTQEGVDYDRPKPEEVGKCKISARKIDGRVGWVVESPEGIILRKFVDTNGDNVVDQWSYFKDGVEVYRDIDSKFTGKADQFRWFNTAGTRWGVDKSGDGKIGAWKVLSAEEATAEIVAALAGRDAQRFSRVLLTRDELSTLGLGKARSDALTAKIAKAEADFKSMAARQNVISSDSKWLQFSGTRPGTVPAGTDDSSKDLRAYENVVAIVQTGDKHLQVQIGTLVQVGDVWKVIDSPVIVGDGQPEVAAGGFFFQATPATRSVAAAPGPGDEGQTLLIKLGEIDKALEKAATADEQIQCNARRADLLQQIAEQARSPEERIMWYRQLADMISAAVQSGKCPDGDKRLQTLLEKLQKSEGDKGLAAYVKFRQLTAAYGLSLQAPKTDFPKIQTEWLKNLEQYIADYPTTPDAAEAMLQLGIAREFAGEEENAKKWYNRIGKEFADSPVAKKAAGAVTRLESVGKPITLTGKSPSGGTVSLANYRGKVVLIQYWATWCGPCKNDMAVLQQLSTKFAPSFAVISVSLDNNAKDLNAFLAENKLTWPQIFEEGGLDSRPANALGILTVPTMILVDQQGKVVNRNIQMADLEGELKKLIK